MEKLMRHFVECLNHKSIQVSGADCHSILAVKILVIKLILLSVKCFSDNVGICWFASHCAWNLVGFMLPAAWSVSQPLPSSQYQSSSIMTELGRRFWVTSCCILYPIHLIYHYLEPFPWCQLLGVPAVSPQSPAQSCSAQWKERARGKIGVQWGPRMTSCLQRNKRPRATQKLGAYSLRKTLRALQQDVFDTQRGGQGL